MTEPVQSTGALDLSRDAVCIGPALAPETAITGCAIDSRAVKPGFVFCAIKGAALDGARFVQYAARQGAAAAFVTRAGAVTAFATGYGREWPAIPLMIVDDPRHWAARLAAVFAGAQPETVAAVTGTSGKTSVADFLRQIWDLLDLKAASFGTMGVTTPAGHDDGGLTTPDPIALHGLLARLSGEGITHAAMEASSHGLDQRRLDGVALRAVAMTNLARDHMDYHADEADYAAAKLRLFSDLAPADATAVLNADDPVCAVAAAIARGRGLSVLRVGTAEDADLRLCDAQYSPTGQRVAFFHGGSVHTVDLSLIGAFQARNVLTAAALAIGCGAQASEVFGTLPQLTGVRGRMQRVAKRANGAPVFVDYAHKPDAVAAALTGLRPHVTGRIHIVLGAGGDRDAGKRPLMGEAAALGADVVIVTDDNPRSEDPATIRRAVLGGAPEATEIGDRAEAILTGVDGLGPQDALLIAGKGHETGQKIGETLVPFDDAEQARAAVAALDALEMEQ